MLVGRQPERLLCPQTQYIEVHVAGVLAAVFGHPRKRHAIAGGRKRRPSLHARIGG
jgi:hypothetical protein